MNESDRSCGKFQNGDGQTITVERLTRVFRGLTAVDGISFGVRAGEIFGFLGPNGAGKTTTLRMLCTLLRPSAGRAAVCGYDIVRQQFAVRRMLGVVFQDPSLDDRLTARENLLIHSLIYRLPRSEVPARIQQVLDWMQLAERADDLVRNFSGGMKRRLEIARGLLHSPRVLFLDEPTLGLDPQTRSRIWEYLRQLPAAHGVTLFMTTHYMDEAEYCNRIAIIDQGRIIALDTPENLKNKVGGDIIHLVTDDNEAAARELKLKYGIDAQRDDSGLHFEVANGAQEIPRLIRELAPAVLAVSSRRPTLDDVFLKLTGREIRDTEASSREQLKSVVRRMGRALR